LSNVNLFEPVLQPKFSSATYFAVLTNTAWVVTSRIDWTEKTYLETKVEILYIFLPFYSKWSVLFLCGY